MRLWSLHPRYLDRAGLLALWREALLAQAVLKGQTRGYGRHPQLSRFRDQADPEGAIAAYLASILREAQRRGYRFDGTKIGPRRGGSMPVTAGQLAYERGHLLGKLLTRDPGRALMLLEVDSPEPHPLFRIVAGRIEGWEKIPATGQAPPGKRALPERPRGTVPAAGSD
jgi:hypothetical protein